MVLLGPASVHCLLLYAAGVPLEQVSTQELWPPPIPGAAGTQQGADRGHLEPWGPCVLTAGFPQVRGEPDHDDQGLHILDLHGADPALPRPHQVLPRRPLLL